MQPLLCDSKLLLVAGRSPNMLAEPSQAVEESAQSTTSSMALRRGMLALQCFARQTITLMFSALKSAPRRPHKRPTRMQKIKVLGSHRVVGIRTEIK